MTRLKVFNGFLGNSGFLKKNAKTFCEQREFLKRLLLLVVSSWTLVAQAF